DGLSCELDGVETTRHPRAAANPAAIGPCDVVLVLVKSSQTAWAAEQALYLLNADARQADKACPEWQRRETKRQAEKGQRVALSRALVVTLQNGLGNHELLAAALGEDRVGQGTTSLGATLLGPGRVRHAGQGVTLFGAAPNPGGMAALAELFRACGLPAEVSDDLDSLVWGKLVVNAGINALTALLRVPNGALATVAEARALMAGAVAEAVAVAQARGTPLPYDIPLAHVLGVARATGAN